MDKTPNRPILRLKYHKSKDSLLDRLFPPLDTMRLNIIGAIYLRDGREAILYRLTYEDVVIATNPGNHRNARFLQRALRVDGEPVTFDDIIRFDNSDFERLRNMMHEAMDHQQKNK